LTVKENVSTVEGSQNAVYDSTHCVPR